MIAGVHELVRLQVADEQDVFLARQRGRSVAAIVGLDNQDQIRVATALSELSRELAGSTEPARITFGLAAAPVPMLVITATWPASRRRSDLAGTEGLAAASRLVDTCEVTNGERVGTAVLTRKLPANAEPVTAARIAQLRTRCRTARIGSALDGLRIQNQDLLTALEDLQARQDDLLRANAELEETNQGVLALHAELSDELEQTNRGVVALYAELDEMTRQLREASESKTRFWAGVSHELRTPLNSILGLARLLLDAGSDALTGEQRHQVELIRDSGSTLLSLVNDLLDVAKAESRQIEVRAQVMDLRPLLQRLRASLLPMLAPGVDLTLDTPADGLVLRSDPTLLERVLSNMLSNAVKFTEKGWVCCAAKVVSDTDTMLISVSDTGIGISAEHQAHVFEEFYQVPGPLQRPRAGTGLGLAYARRVAGVLGGSLDLQSEPGRGTVVTLRLPLLLGVTSPGRFSRVLVVDDDPGFRAIAHSALKAFANQVVDAENGAGALRMLAEQRPDLVMLDLNIPAPSGADVLEEMRRTPGLDDVPVVVLTSAHLDTTQHALLSTSAVVLDKARFSADLLPHAAGDAARLVERSP